MLTHFKIFLLFLLWLYTVYSNPTTKDPLDLTVIKDSTIRGSPTSPDGLPNDVAVDFDVLGKHVQLKLKRNSKFQGRDEVLVMKKSETNISVVVSQTLILGEVYGEYQDSSNGAIFTISCQTNGVSGNGTQCESSMEGTFRASGVEYRMQPMDDTALHRARRSAPQKLWNRAVNIISTAGKFSKVYGIYPAESSKGTPTDYIEAEPLIRGRVAEAFGNKAKIVRENILPGGRKYNLEILVIADFGMYQRFYKASKLGTETAKDNEAKINIRKYLAHVFNGVDMLYQSINDPEFSISIAVSGFIIADSPDVSPWTSPHVNRVTGGRDELSVSEALNELIRWSFTARNIPENDHVMLITDYDLYSVDSGRKDLRTAGYARVSSVCSLDSVSLVEDHGGFQSINAAAHELGHGLGARHDGSPNQCIARNQFVMTAHGGFEQEETKMNPWKFSKCSVDYFKKYINTLRPGHCLTDPVDIYNRDEFLKYVSNYPGQDMTPNQQCQDILGLDSYYGWGPELGSFSNICTEMSCALPGSGRSYRVYKAATGTSCGDKRWCIKGQCVFDEQAPTKTASCVFGDTQRLFGSQQLSCRQYILANPMSCYNDFYRTRCCDTCELINTGVTGCEYGDKFKNCRRGGCFDPNYSRDCCSTCGLAPPPVIRTTIAPPTTRTTTTRRPPTTRRPIWRPPVVRTTRRPIIITRPPVVRTTRRPFIPITWRPITPRPTTRATSRPIIPSGSSGLCLRQNARFLLVFRCSSLTSMFGSRACDNSMVARYCCEPCPKAGEAVCEDSPSCNVRYSRECYFQSKKDKCCRTCRGFHTGITDCEYGDRIRSCERYVSGLGIDIVCQRYKKYCCKMCSSITARATDEITSVTDAPLPPKSGSIGGIPKLPKVKKEKKGRGKGGKDKKGKKGVKGQNKKWKKARFNKRNNGRGKGKNKNNTQPFKTANTRTFIIRIGKGRGNRRNLRADQRRDLLSNFRLAIGKGK